MYNTCLRICGNAELAKDIFQDAFIRAIDNIRHLKDNNSFGGWLKRIVINECIKQNEKERRFTEFETDSEDLAEGNANWLSLIDLAMVQREISNLPDGCRQVFVLYAVEDYSHKEIAELLGISLSTSKSQYQRARKLLKEKLINDN
jgi:RNA polymerase sigma-70 factor (ECF subfamily)